MGAAAVPLIMTAVSAGAQYVNSRNQQRKAERETAASIAARTQRQHRADDEVRNLIGTIKASNADDERSVLTNAYNSQIAKARAGSSNPLLQGNAGNSARYNDEALNASIGVNNKVDALAGLVAGLDAPLLQRQDEGFKTDRYQDAIKLIGREQEGDNALLDMRLKSIRDNPWLLALSQVAGAAANAYGSGGGGGAAAAGLGAQANAIGQRSLSQIGQQNLATTLRGWGN